MAKLSLTAKLNFLLLTPIVFISAGNAYLLYLAEEPLLQLGNLALFSGVFSGTLFFTHRFSRKFEKKLKIINHRLESTSSCAYLLKTEVETMENLSTLKESLISLDHQSRVIFHWYDELKELLKVSVVKADLTQSKELGRLCREVGHGAVEIKDTLEIALEALKMRDEARVRLIAENLIRNCERLKGESEIEEGTLVPFELKTGPLRRAIKLAEKRRNVA